MIHFSMLLLRSHRTRVCRRSSPPLLPLVCIRLRQAATSHALWDSGKVVYYAYFMYVHFSPVIWNIDVILDGVCSWHVHAVSGARMLVRVVSIFVGRGAKLATILQ